jgi:hypothetical protein
MTLPPSPPPPPSITTCKSSLVSHSKCCYCEIIIYTIRILSTNKIDRHDEAEILLKMALSTITLADVVPVVEIS